MPRVCRSCSRLNPDAARYCFHDGVALASAGPVGPIAVGTQLFLAPFVFPSGKACRTFDELLLACESDWEAARDMLGQGYFEGFLGSLGRADLALAARQAAREPDKDRALDLLLSKLPGDRQRPFLVVQPREVNLGQIKRGEDRSFTLHLANQGMGLLSGNLQSQVPWLALGEAPGVPSKVFQCRHELAVPVHIHGKALRSHPRSQEGRILVESSAGSVALLVQVEVPMVPYPDGPLAGALTPRHLAEKAKQHPREAAPLFESGAVANWYEANGWTYPVQGPNASGMAAVQQFFEALGLTKPPVVQINQTVIDLRGSPGGNVETFLFVESPENRPVYAHALTDTPWLQIGKARSQNNSVRIHLRVPAVPNQPGAILHGQALVIANGNQRFPIAVTLTVDRVAGMAVPAQPPVQQWAAAPPPVRLAGNQADAHALAQAANWRQNIELLQAVAVKVDEPPVFEVGPIGIADKGRVIQMEAPASILQPIGLPPPPVRTPEAVPVHLEQATTPGSPFRHFLLLGVILFGLLGTVVHDLLLPAGDPIIDDDDAGPVLVNSEPLVELRFHDGPNPEERSEYPSQSMSFGLKVREKTPGPGAGKRLMYDLMGRTNNTCLRIDDRDYLFGMPDIVFPRPGAAATRVANAGRWINMRNGLGKVPSTGRTRDGAMSVWQVNGYSAHKCSLEVTQTVEIVPGEQSGRLDTCLIQYTMRNTDSIPHDVGLRFLLDTWIGENDGVPFTIPGKAGLCSTKQSFGRPEDVPDYIQALEKDDLLAPGTIAHLQFKIPGRLESPSRVFLGGYPDQPLQYLGYREANGWYTPWEVPFVSIREEADRRDELKRLLDNEHKKLQRDPPPPDSAVTLYWDVKRLAVGERREVGFSYGLGSVASREGEGKLLLTVGGRMVRDGEFTLTALRASPVRGEKLTLTLPASGRFELLDSAEQPVPEVVAGSSRPISTVTWRLKARLAGKSTVTVRSSAGVSQKQTIVIRPPAQGVLD